MVDVNTGKFTGAGGNLEETVTKNNIEAAEEIVRQLRLRDIGGIIVVDFIDMVLESNRDLVLRRLLECLGRDRTKHQVAEVTSLGLVQMTRKRVGQGLLEVFSENCEHCGGRGLIMHDEPVEKRGDGDSGTNGGGSGGTRRQSRHGSGGGGGRDQGREAAAPAASGSSGSGSSSGSSRRGRGRRRLLGRFGQRRRRCRFDRLMAPSVGCPFGAPWLTAETSGRVGPSGLAERAVRHSRQSASVTAVRNSSGQEESEYQVYAIVRAGGRQEKVSVGDVLNVDKLDGEAGSSIALTPLLLVDGETVTSATAALAKASVTAEIVEPAKGPKITIMKFKNKTGYRKRQGHRQKLTRIKVTGISL